MVVGTGIDIVEVRRIRQAIERWGERFLRRIFTPGEIRYCRGRPQPEISFAARFAAKEAAMKALGRGPGGGVRWKSLEVVNLASGAPEMRTTPALQPLMVGKRLLISLSHTGNSALALALLMDDGGEET